MLCMAKCVTIRPRVSRGSRVSFLIVANAARRHLAARVGFAARRVTRVTLAMRGQARGNRQRGGTASQPAVTRGASARGPGRSGHVLSMIKFHIEAFIEPSGEIVQRRIRAVDVRMTNHTHRHIGGNKLRQVTTGARFMSREPRRRRVVCALVTGGAGLRRMA